MTNGRNFFDQPVKNDLVHNWLSTRLSLVQRTLVIDLSKQHAIHANQKAIQLINLLET